MRGQLREPLPSVVRESPWIVERRELLALIRREFEHPLQRGPVWAAGVERLFGCVARADADCGLCGRAADPVVADFMVDAALPCPECGVEPLTLACCESCLAELAHSSSDAAESAPVPGAARVRAGLTCCSICSAQRRAGVLIEFDAHAHHFHSDDGSPCPLAPFQGPQRAWSGLCVGCLEGLAQLVARGKARLERWHEGEVIAAELRGVDAPAPPA